MSSLSTNLQHSVRPKNTFTYELAKLGCEDVFIEDISAILFYIGSKIWSIGIICRIFWYVFFQILKIILSKHPPTQKPYH